MDEWSIWIPEELRADAHKLSELATRLNGGADEWWIACEIIEIRQNLAAMLANLDGKHLRSPNEWK
jgi:hypothetical protein